MLKNFIKLSISALTLFAVMNYSYAQMYWGLYIQILIQE